jgi:beta-ribofuranosylaminobenzene 5'-phosphate synthase
MTRVEAAARLHFGLLSAPVAGNADPSARQYGGVGLMIDSPKVVLHASMAGQWSAAGPDAPRALAFAQKFTATLPIDRQSPFAFEIEQCPESHAGLGSGTALALAVAKAIALEIGLGDWPAVELAKRVGRGARSAVGVHGFQHGGLIVEAGKTGAERVAPLVGSYEFPTEWRLVLARTPVDAGWHGPREARAFESLTHVNPTELLWRLVTKGIVPALQARDVDAFGDAVHEYNVRAGEAFADQQGGDYASPAVAELVGRLRKRGIRGVGQSSWGPTVFAVMRDQEEANDLVQFIRRQLGMEDRQLCIIHAAPLKNLDQNQSNLTTKHTKHTK